MNNFESQEGSKFQMLSDRDKGRLRAFQHLLRQIKKYESVILSGKTLHWGYANAEGKVTETHLVINKNLLRKLRAMAKGMYISDLAETSHVRGIADAIVAAELGNGDADTKKR